MSNPISGLRWACSAGAGTSPHTSSTQHCHSAASVPCSPPPCPSSCSMFSPRQFGWLSPHHRSGGIVLTTDIREHGAGCMFTEPLGSPGLFSRSPTSLTAALCHLPSTPSSQLYNSSHTSFSGDPTCHFDADEPQLTAPLALPHLLHGASTQLTPGDGELHMSKWPPHRSLDSSAGNFTMCMPLPPSPSG